MKFLDKESSRQYSQVLEEVMKVNLRKESHGSLRRSKSKSKASANEFSPDIKTNNYHTVIPTK